MGAFVFWYQATYNVLPGQSASSRVHWCGRDYGWPGGTRTRAQLTARTAGRPRLAGHYPPLGDRAALYAQVVPVAQRSRYGGSCATVVYLRTAPDRYRSYVLEGGP